MADEIESLFVRIEGNIAPLLDDTKRGVSQAAGELGKFETQGKKAFDNTGQAAKGLSSVLTGVVLGAVFAVTTALINMAVKGVAAIGNMARQAVGLQSELEQARITFTKIFGDAQSAELFLSGLKEQAAALGVSFGDASRFAKSILPDTRSLEEFNELLRLAAVGARDANVGLTELIFSFNEAVAGDFKSIRDRLDIPPDVIDRIKAADDTTGALVTELNALFTKRGINDVAAFADTLGGVTNRLQAIGERLLEISGRKGFEQLKLIAQDFLTLLQDNEAPLERVAMAVGDIAGAALEIVRTGIDGTLSQIDFEAWAEFGETIADLGDTVSLLAQTLPGVNLSAGVLENASSLLDLLRQALVTAAQIGAIAKANLAAQQAEQAALSAAMGASARRGAFGQVLPGQATAEDRAAAEAAGQRAYNAVIEEAVAAFDDYNSKIDERAKRQWQAADAVDGDTSALKFNRDALDDAAAGNEELVKSLAKYGAELLDLRADINRQVEELQAGHNERLADLTAQAAQQSAQVIANSQRDLQKVYDETDQAINERRAEHNQEQLRDLEDFLRSERRAREDHLYTLGQAVAARDARQIVDERLRYQRERQRAGEDFNVNRQRAGEDFSQELEDLRQAETERANEITNRRAEQLAAIEANLEQQASKENAAYAEQQAKLEAAMEERLATIARGLGGQLEMEDETAEQILNLLASVYGSDGSATQILEEFAQRRRAILDLTADLEQQAAADQTSSTGARGMPPARDVPGFAAGGSFTASRPTLIAVGEGFRPERVTITPVNGISTNRTEGAFDVNVNFSGVPSHIDQGQMEEVVSKVMVGALRQAGMR